MFASLYLGLYDCRSADLLAVNADGNMPYDICEDEETLEYIETQMADQGVTQELIDEMRLSTEKKMLDDIKEFEREGQQVSAWVDRTGATLVCVTVILMAGVVWTKSGGAYFCNLPLWQLESLTNNNQTRLVLWLPD